MTGPAKPSARSAVGAPAHLLLLAEAHLRRDVRTRHRQRAGLTAAAIGEHHLRAHQVVDDLHRRVRLHRRVARIVVHVARARDAVEPHALLEQVLVDVEQPAAREDALELVLHELVHARAAGHDHGADVEVVERVRDAMEQHAVRRRDRLAPCRDCPRRSAGTRSRGSRAAARPARRRARASPASRAPPARTAAPSRSRGSRTPPPARPRRATGRGRSAPPCRPRCRAAPARCASAAPPASAC